MHTIGIRGHLATFTQNYISDRKFRVKVHSVISEEYSQNEGVVQGGVFSVILFALAINDIVNVIPSNIGRSLFVDDLAIWRSSSSLPIAERQIQLTVNKLQRWATMHGFKFSCRKTVAVHFCRIHSCVSDPQISLYGRTIPVVDSTKFLGVVFDKSLTFKPHVSFSKDRDRVQESLNILKYVAKVTYGGDRKTSLNTCRGLVR